MLEAEQYDSSNVTGIQASSGIVLSDTPVHATPNPAAMLSRPKLCGWLYPEEILAIGLLVITVAVNITIHRTFNTAILYQNVSTYRALFAGQVDYFFNALKYCVIALIGLQALRWAVGLKPRLVVWGQIGAYFTAIRALLVYFLCAVAFGNLEGFIHFLSPTDRDNWLIAIDRAMFLGHDPLKLLEPLVTPWRVHFLMQIYISMMIMPFVTMVVFLHQGKLRAFRDTIVSLVLGLVISYPVYLIVPAIGPQYTLRYIFVRPVFNVDAMLSQGLDRLTRDTFPSVHTAVSMICMLLVWRYSTNRLYRIAFAAWSLSIVFSTMYLRFHYVVDVIAGVLVSMLVTWLGPRLNDWYFGRDTAETRWRGRGGPVVIDERMET
jgi:membrane-associated phospholipid phosphatase